LTYFPERASDRFAYLTLFPIGGAMRANLFVYRSLRDPWLHAFRSAPEAALLAAMPGLKKLMGAFAVSGKIKIRPVDLTAIAGYRQPGVVLVGDAFATSCPAAGTGVNKVLTDVERLCNVYVPLWFGTDGMDTDKIGAFYDDPIKTACDASSIRKAWHLRSLSTAISIPWRVRRWSRSLAQAGVFAARQTRERLSMRPPGRGGTDPYARPCEPRG
jgi:2-polyprenyl-6-methoxyphenol hydroxylase-like FAD-dependent oxidoreductase